MRRTRQDLGFVALRVEGGILPAEFLRKVVTLDARGQTAQDYRLPKGTTIKDEIGRAWRIASAEWREFRDNIDRSDIDRWKIGVAGWLKNLMTVVLGYSDLDGCSAISIGDRSFPITHRGLGGVVPVILTVPNFRLDKADQRFGEEGRRRSPHALMQEFLNASNECLWGIISNGLVMQVLRDNPSLTRPAFVEADLERIFEEQLYSDFAAFWLIFHSSRFLGHDGDTFACWAEKWRQEAHEAGERALADLRGGVTLALVELGNGFLQHKGNDKLRELLKSGEANTSDYFKELLRLVYRLLFLFTVEERNLLHVAGTDEEAREIYRAGYSVGRLRDAALKRRKYDEYSDLWEGLLVSFKGLSYGATNIGLPALDGLFAADQCPLLESCFVQNDFLLRAVFALSFFRSGDVLARVNYRDMDTEELGSVYESLLELHPSIDVEKSPWSLSLIGSEDAERAGGSERKITGSYYTPSGLVAELVETALAPVIDQVKTTNPQNPKTELLNLRIVDPACGSGHFLLAAARRLATEIARLDIGSEVAEEELRRSALREVVRHCIFGVDKNPLAVELCKTALWIESLQVGKPLAFLDPHIRCGDSLVGILDPTQLDKGIPDAAFEALSGDEDAIAKELKRQNKAAVGEAIQGNVFDQNNLEKVKGTRFAVEEMPEDNLEQIAAKKIAWQKAEVDKSRLDEQFKANVYVGAFFAPKTSGKLDEVPTTEDLKRLAIGLSARKQIGTSVASLARKHRFFHWYIDFAEIFAHGGFDVVLGNPPWEQTELKEKEWFAVRRPDIAAALTGASRKKMIEKLSVEDPRMYREFINELRASEAVGQFVRHSERFPLCRRGRINTYAIFAELNSKLIHSTGRVGCIVPTGIATDDTTKLFFQHISETGRLVSLFDFENAKGIFPGVHRSYKFCLLTLTGSGAAKSEADFVFFAHDVAELQNPERHFVLSANDFALLNPNTRTCPIFRSKADAELTKKLYAAAPVLKRNDNATANAWGVTFKQGLFNMTSDSGLFRTKEQLLNDGWKLKGNVFEKVADSRTNRFLPLYEAKLIHQFDHRWATYEQLDTRDLTDKERGNPDTVALPRYWVASDEVEVQLRDKWKSSWMLGFRGVCRTTDERSAIFCMLPRVGAGHSLFLVMDKFGDVSLACSQLANFNSLVFDYVARQKVGGINFSFYIVEQLPVIPPTVHMGPCPWEQRVLLKDWLMARVLELTYTAHDLAGFAKDCCYEGPPFPWDEERRFKLRCELDAAFCFLYGLSNQDIEYVLETFPILKRKDESRFGEYRTKRTISDCFERMSKARKDGTKYASILSPEPQNPCLQEIST